MEKSIENIWQSGFLNADALVAPKVNTVYDRKSLHVINKLANMFKWNLIYIMIAAVCLLVMFSVIGGAIWAGVTLFFLLSWLVWHSKKSGASLQQIDQTKNSFEYLSSFEEWLEVQISKYAKINRLFYPAVIGTFSLGILYSDPVYNKLISSDKILFYEGHPIYVTLGMIVYALLFGIFAGPVYRKDIKIVYGPTMKKLKELLADMEELRKD